MAEIQGTQDPTAEEIAARLRGIWEENRQWLTRPEWRPRERRVELLERLGRVRYRENESPDRFATLERLLIENEGDCEDLCAASHTLLETLLPVDFEIESILTPGGPPRLHHAALRLFCPAWGQWRVFDPSAALPKGRNMSAPPARIYSDPRAVVIARRVVSPF